MSLEDIVRIPANDSLIVVGRVEHLIIDSEAYDDNDYINLESIETAGISGLNSYYGLKKLADFPYARVNDLPNFSG